MPQLAAARDIKYSLAIEALRSQGRVRVAAFGTSMLPTIWPGDVLEISRTELQELNAGDVVALVLADGLRVHRLEALVATADGTYLRTRGDSVPESDPLTPANQLAGKVVGLERLGRSMQVRRQTWAVRALGAVFGRSANLQNAALRLQTLRASMTTWICLKRQESEA